MEIIKHDERYHQLNQLYNARLDVPHLRLNITQHGNDVLKINLINEDYRKTQIKYLKRISKLLVLYFSVYLTCQWLSWNRHVVVDLTFLLLLLFILQRMSFVIQKANLVICRDFAVQFGTTRNFFMHKNAFIPIENVYDIVINEVIENLDIHYILLLRTKGDRPLYTIFNEMYPTVDCLNIIRKQVNKFLHKSSPS